MIDELSYKVNIGFLICVDQNIFSIENNKYVEFFSQDFIDVVLKTCKSVSLFKLYYLVFIISISSLNSCFLLIYFFNFSFFESNYQINLGKLFCFF